MGGLGGVKGSVPTGAGLWASLLVLPSLLRYRGGSLLTALLSHGEGGQHSEIHPFQGSGVVA